MAALRRLFRCNRTQAERDPDPRLVCVPDAATGATCESELDLLRLLSEPEATDV